MASINSFIFSCFLFFLLSCLSNAAFKPQSLVLPVTKDPSSLQHITYITHKHPLNPIKLLVDIGANTLWVDCDQAYNSTTYKHVKCKSPQCKLAKPFGCGDGCYLAPILPKCTNDTCYTTPYGPYSASYLQGGVVSQDVILMLGIDGKKLTKVTSIKNFIFTCVPNWFIAGFPSGMKGLVGLGWSDIALPTQLAKDFNFPRKFGICLSSSTKSQGAIVFGNVPLNANFKNLFTTPLLTSPLGVGAVPSLKEPSSQYYIGVKSIKINGKALSLNTTLLKINKLGYYGTMISTTTPYTMLDESIFKAVSEGFLKHFSNVKRVASVEPFGLCFDAKSIIGSKEKIPSIDLVLQNKSAYWSISGEKLIVQVNENVVCLGFVDAGPVEFKFEVIGSITIGSHQLEDNLLQFDLAKRRLSLTSLGSGKAISKCNDFNIG